LLVRTQAEIDTEPSYAIAEVVVPVDTDESSAPPVLADYAETEVVVPVDTDESSAPPVAYEEAAPEKQIQEDKES